MIGAKALQQEPLFTTTVYMSFKQKDRTSLCPLCGRVESRRGLLCVECLNRTNFRLDIRKLFAPQPKKIPDAELKIDGEYIMMSDHSSTVYLNRRAAVFLLKRLPRLIAKLAK